MAAGDARMRSRPKRLLALVAAAAMVGVAGVACSSSGNSSSTSGPVTLEFAQWWGAELPTGSFEKMMSAFTAHNPNIKVKLFSAPYASTKQQPVSGAAARAPPDAVALGGGCVCDFA